MKQTSRKRSTFSIALTTAATIILGGCGGGSTTTNTTTNNIVNLSATGQTAVDNAIAQMTAATNAEVSWWVQSMNNTTGAATAAQASVYTLTTTATTGLYNVTLALKQVSLPGAWATVPGASFLNLTSTGWSSASTLNNNGNGTTSSNGGATSTIATTDLSGTVVTCTYGSNPVAGGATAQTCPATTTYPSGSMQIKRVTTTTADAYRLFDIPAAPSSITNQSGVALTALPVVGTTFCLADGPNTQANVWAAKVPAPAAGNDNYNLYSVPSCTATNITNALAAAATGSALVVTTATGLAGVTVLSMRRIVTQGTFNNIAAFNSTTFLTGDMTPVGIRTDYTVNKTAANAQLTAHGLPTLP